MREHKFRRNFMLNPLCVEIETATYFFLCCHFYNENQAILMKDFENIDQSLQKLLLSLSSSNLQEGFGTYHIP